MTNNTVQATLILILLSLGNTTFGMFKALDIDPSQSDTHIEQQVRTALAKYQPKFTTQHEPEAKIPSNNQIPQPTQIALVNDLSLYTNQEIKDAQAIHDVAIHYHKNDIFFNVPVFNGYLSSAPTAISSKTLTLSASFITDTINSQKRLPHYQTFEEVGLMHRELAREFLIQNKNQDDRILTLLTNYHRLKTCILFIDRFGHHTPEYEKIMHIARHRWHECQCSEYPEWPLIR